MSHKTVTAIMLILFAASSLVAQAFPPPPDPTEFETVLVPIVLVSPLWTLGGSWWRTESFARNSGRDPVRFFQQLPCCGEVPHLDPGETQNLAAYGAFALVGNPGMIFHVERSGATEVVFSNRLSRIDDAAHPRAEVFAVRESDFRDVPIEFINLPVDYALRLTLRIYDPFALEVSPVRVQVFDNDQLLGEKDFRLDRALNTIETFPYIPGYVEIGPMTAQFPSISGHDRIRVLVTPLLSGQRLWAMVSITDNATDNIVIIPPQ